MRTLLVTGPGGAGTSTVAAAAAVRSARAGRSTLLLGTGAPPVAGLDAEPHLEVRRVGGTQATAALWAEHVETLAGAVPFLDLPPASSVVPIPGADALALTAALAGAEAEVVVLDAGPLEGGLALAALPSTLRWWLDQLLPPAVRALGAVRTAGVSAGAVRRGPVDAVLAALPALEGLLARERLADPTGTAVWLTGEARGPAAAALRRAVTVLGLHGMRPAAVVARALPADGPGDWWRERSAAQEAALAALAELAPVHAVTEAPEGPADVPAALALLDGLDLPAAGGPAAPGPRRAEGGWQLDVPLPFAERATATLTRWGDDLVVGVGEDRRSLRLDSLLRRCVVTGGRLADPGTAAARLEVSFRPDPQQWPADLLAAEGRTS
ncbi:ion transporter [Blastococcus sp. TF02A-35]|uniref:ArsA family ATPase n=1 Tax=Blastococcus sp. TF02A-35 TaxID=2559612 RepID=UPI0010741057|nr:ion transporter [Blastococcus sp. TF02A_35]TFV52226.1 ion transporter [Blastococcus sp. TF02A_35]